MVEMDAFSSSLSTFQLQIFPTAPVRPEPSKSVLVVSEWNGTEWICEIDKRGYFWGQRIHYAERMA
jgi:hypothetical protein